MKIKQLAERMGVPPQQMDIELAMPCKECKRMGGQKAFDCETCEVRAIIRAQDE